MKKLLINMLLITTVTVCSAIKTFADEIIFQSGQHINCKIETVSGGLIEYKTKGNINSLIRAVNDNDRQDFVEIGLLKSNTVRYSGKVLYKDSYSLRIKTQNGDLTVPWYKVKFISLFIPQ